MSQSDTADTPRQGHPAAAASPHPAVALLNLICCLLAPLFLGNQPGNVSEAIGTAVDTVTCYRPRSHAELVKIGQIIAFGMAVLDTLRLSMGAEVPLAMKLRLRSCANGLHRSAQQNSSALERNRREAATPAAAPVYAAAAAQEPPMDLDDMMVRAQDMLRDFQAQIAGVSPPGASAPSASDAMASAPSASAPITPADAGSTGARFEGISAGAFAEPMPDAPFCDEPWLETGMTEAALFKAARFEATGCDATLPDAPAAAPPFEASPFVAPLSTGLVPEMAEPPAARAATLQPAMAEAPNPATPIATADHGAARPGTPVAEADEPGAADAGAPTAGAVACRGYRWRAADPRDDAKGNDVGDLSVRPADAVNTVAPGVAPGVHHEAILSADGTKAGGLTANLRIGDRSGIENSGAKGQGAEGPGAKGPGAKGPGVEGLNMAGSGAKGLGVERCTAQSPAANRLRGDRHHVGSESLGRQNVGTPDADAVGVDVRAGGAPAAGVPTADAGGLDATAVNVSGIDVPAMAGGVEGAGGTDRSMPVADALVPHDRPDPGRPTAGHPVAGHPVAGHPVAGQPKAAHPKPGRPTAARPKPGWPTAGRPDAVSLAATGQPFPIWATPASVGSQPIPAASTATPATTRASIRSASVARNILASGGNMSMPTGIPAGVAWNREQKGRAAWSASMANVATSLMANLANVSPEQRKTDMMWIQALFGSASDLATKAGGPPVSAATASPRPKADPPLK